MGNIAYLSQIGTNNFEQEQEAFIMRGITPNPIFIQTLKVRRTNWLMFF